MARQKCACVKWTLAITLILVCPYVYSRPQEAVSSVTVTSTSVNDPTTEKSIRDATQKSNDAIKSTEKEPLAAETLSDVSRRVKTKGPVLGESIKMVATQLLENHANKTTNSPIVADTRIPPKLKAHLDQKHKIKTRNEDGNEPVENSHIGIAVPISMEELEKENKVDVVSESSTSNEGISTWILLSNPTNKENISSSTEAIKVEELQKKQKPAPTKNKNKRPQNKISAKRPIIGSTNKSDLVAGGSAINENVLNKLKDTVLTNVQKNKNTQAFTAVTTTVAPTTDTPATKKEVATKPTTVVPVVKVSSKPIKKKNKNKPKATTTPAPIDDESAQLPMEAKEQEIELEISTPATTTKKPKRTSSKKKNKTKKRKTTKPKTEEETSVTETKTSNKTKSAKPSKKPVTDIAAGPITSQIFSYLSREVMPSAVGVGVIGLASLVGLASYFFYPFATPVRRTLEVDKKDDLYRHNAEEYASEGNGQPEEEMLGTVLAGMPAHTRQKLNPYAGQTTAQVSRYPVKKEQDLRYRHVANKYEPSPNYNAHYPQQKTGIAHGAVYSEPVNYNPHQYETKHAYTTESKYTFEKASSAYTPYSAVEPIYAVPQSGPSGQSGVSSYDNDASNSVVYGVKPSSDTDFKPVYHYDGQFYSETTNSPGTYSPTSMYLGSNDDFDKESDMIFKDNATDKKDIIDEKFVVGNVPKEIVESATPAVVPEHGPRQLSRRKRNILLRKRSIVGSIEEIIKAAKENNKEDIFISNEIDESYGITTKKQPFLNEKMKIEAVTEAKEVVPVYAVSVNPEKNEKTTLTDSPTTVPSVIIESVSTVPVDAMKEEKTTATDMSNDLDVSTKGFKVYEIFPTTDPSSVTEQSNPVTASSKLESTTQARNANTETTTESKSEASTTSIPPSLETKTTSKPVTQKPKPTYYPEVITYPPLNQEGSFFTFLKRLVEFKYRLGLSILQTTSENLNRYLRNMERNIQT